MEVSEWVKVDEGVEIRISEWVKVDEAAIRWMKVDERVRK